MENIVKELLPTNLLAVSVPHNSHSFGFENGDLFYKDNFIGFKDITHHRELNMSIKVHVLGTINFGKPDFDVLELNLFEKLPENLKDPLRNRTLRMMSKDLLSSILIENGFKPSQKVLILKKSQSAK
jgi:hypothetical protein